MRTLMFLGLVLVCPCRALLAQVGHPPQSTPYRDIRKGHSLTAIFGYFGGDGGRFNLGPHDGEVYGVRYDIRTGSTIQAGLEVAWGDLDRFIIDPFQATGNRKAGPVSQSMTFLDAMTQFNLTGGKSWHRIAPYIGGAIGLAFAGSTPADTSNFDFGNKWYLSPLLGFRAFVTDRLHLRAEARAVFWKLKYPTTFLISTPESPAVITVENQLTEWDSSSWLQLGLGYSFSL
jgi:hypothetical protein